MKTYKVKISYTVEINEDDGVLDKTEAIDLALMRFIDGGDYQYANVEVEEVER